MAERVSPVSTRSRSGAERAWMGKAPHRARGVPVHSDDPAAAGAVADRADDSMLLVPAIAACALVGWWAGGRAFLAIAWVAIATLLMAPVRWRHRARSTISCAAGACCSRARSGSSACSGTTAAAVRARAARRSGSRSVLATVMSLRRARVGVRRRRRPWPTSSRGATPRR